MATFLTVFKVLLFSMALGPAAPLVVPTRMPKLLADCYRRQTAPVNITDVPSQTIVQSCIGELEYETEAFGNTEMTEDARRYIDSLVRKIIGSGEFTRTKRTAVKLRRNKGVRKEVRAMTNEEWKQLTDRINYLKNLTDVQPNRYDAMASFHSGKVLKSSHGGPNYPGWHRIFLLLVEAALGMPIPYWNSTLDYNLFNPINSFVWTEGRFGNGVGEVTTGPFAGWVTPTGPLVRNIGSDGTLMSKPMVDLIMTKRSAAEITEGTDKTIAIYSLEQQQNGPHNWVDGHFSGTNTAAYDPVYLFHAAFVDYIWHLFQEKQRQDGIDPITDYPETTKSLHRKLNSMEPFKGLLNVHAYHKYFDDLTSYEELPPCALCNGENTFGLACVQGQCVATELPDVNAEPNKPSPYGIQEVPDVLPEVAIGERFSSIFTDVRTRQSPLWVAPLPLFLRQKRQTTNTSASAQQEQRNYVNTYSINGKVQENKWVYIAVNVIYRRFEDQNQIHENASKPATYEKCLHTGPSRAKVWVQSNGVNYSGKYKNYVVFHNQQGIIAPSKKVYIGVAEPDKEEVKTYITAHDTCGRACYAMCLDVRSKFPVYNLCSGAFDVSFENPLMYATTKKEENLHNQVVPIIFICDLQLEWPWYLN